jgi:uncharacterized delta-60 repeat protein
MSDGGLDTTFGTGGWEVLNVGQNNYDENSMMAIGPDGRIVLTGYAPEADGAGNDLFVARLAPDGAPDTTFGTLGTGVVYSDFGGNEQGFGVAVQPDGKVVLAGRRAVVGGTVDFLTTRYDATGQLDSTWNPTGPIPGAAWTDFNGNYDAANSVAIQSDGRVVLAGRNNNGNLTDAFALGRYQGDTSPAPLMAAAGPVTGSSAKSLTTGALRPIVAEAIRRWNATGLTAAERKLLRHVRFEIGDLDGATLGLASGNAVTIDRDAAGYGWFVDKTPRRDAEFTRPGDQGERGHMDLLTAVMHELGHVLGHEHAPGGGLMAETLATGVRLNPEPGL